MRYARIWLLAAAVAFTALAPLAAAPLTQADKDYVLGCKANVEPPAGALSPDKAAECLARLNADDAAMMNGLKDEAPVMAVEVVSRSNALVDLRTLISKYEDAKLAQALGRVLENAQCVPCDMGLGSEPEKISPWVKAYIPQREKLYRSSVREWASLGQLRTAGLSAPDFAFSPESWGQQALLIRYWKLHEWAKRGAEQLEASASGGDKPAAYYRKLADLLKEDLLAYGDKNRAAALEKVVSDMEAREAAAAREGQAAKKPVQGAQADKVSASLGAASKDLAAAGESGDTAGYLNHAFDNASPQGGAVAAPPAAFNAAPITRAQAAELSAKMAVMKDGKVSGPIAYELRGTRAGDEILSFYEQKPGGKANKLNFAFQQGTGQLDGTLGWWTAPTGELRINSDLVDKFAKSRRVTPAELLASPELQKELAAYVAPTFVHEATHQRQSAWASANGLDYNVDKHGGRSAPSQMEMETESFSMAASFVSEKASAGGETYLAKLAWWDRDDAARYLADGVDGIRTEKHTYEYYADNLDTAQGAAAKELQAAAGTAKRVAELEAKAKGGALTAAETAELKAGRQALDSRFKWYAMVLAKSKADEAKLLAWRKDIDPRHDVRNMIEDYQALHGGKQ